MTDILLNVDAAAVDWARAQFALTAIYHWLFVPLTLGLAVIMGIMETCYYKTRKPFWRDAARFWQRLFGVNFAMGVATGIILEFEFGTNWSNYSWFVGDIFGAPLAIEGIVAFFMESTFVAVMYFGWGKVSRGFHLAATWLTGIGATLSAWWILVANAWMQYPVGCTFNPDTMRNEMTSFAAVALSPMAVDKFFHTVTSSWIIGALFTVAVSCYYLMRRRHLRLATESIKIGAAVGLVAALLAAFTGDNSAYRVAQVQPMKLAAMEALYDGGDSQSLTAVALVNPFRQPDYANEGEPPLRIGIPNMLSLLATRQADGFVPGINDLLRGGYELPDGRPAMSMDEKIRRGQGAILALQEYRRLKAKRKDRIPWRRGVRAALRARREPEGRHEILRLRLPEGQVAGRAVHPRVLLGLQGDGGAWRGVHSLLRRSAVLRLPPRHQPPPLAPHGSPRHAATGLRGQRSRLGSGRDGAPAMGHTGHDAHVGGRERHRLGQRDGHVLHLPRPFSPPCSP